MGDLEVVMVPHIAWVVSQGLMAWASAPLMALHMASRTMALVPMASPKVMASSLLLMASSHLLMVKNLLQLLTPLRVMVKHSNLLVISHLNSLLTLDSQPITQPTLNSQPTHSHLLMVNHLPILNILSILKVLQLGLNRHPHGSASSSVLKASNFV